MWNLLNISFWKSLRTTLCVDYFDQLESVLADLRARYEHIIPMGDFNTCLIKDDFRSKKFLSLLHSLDLNCLEIRPTHFSHNSRVSLLDLIFTSSCEIIDFHGLFNAAAFSLHHMI